MCLWFQQHMYYIYDINAQKNITKLSALTCFTHELKHCILTSIIRYFQGIREKIKIKNTNIFSRWEINFSTIVCCWCQFMCLYVQSHEQKEYAVLERRKIQMTTIRRKEGIFKRQTMTFFLYITNPIRRNASATARQQSQKRESNSKYKTCSTVTNWKPCSAKAIFCSNKTNTRWMSKAQWKTTTKSKFAHMSRALYFSQDTDLGIVDSHLVCRHQRSKGANTRWCKRKETYQILYILTVSKVYN